MPVYKDSERNTYYVKTYYTDWTGTRRQKMKRGFKLQREAKDWERSFLEKQSGSPDITFQALYDLYLEDICSRLKESTVIVKRRYTEYRLLPYFKDKPINEISPTDIRKWQNMLIQDGLKPTTQSNVNSQLNAILNFAVKYYGLQRNPCSVAGSIGSNKADRIDFWTLEEFKSFIACIDNPMYNVLYNILYYSGLRCGEVLALTPADIDLDKKVIHVTKTFHRLHNEDVITAPKTKNSVRSVPIPGFLRGQIGDYMKRIYGLKATDRIIPLTDRSLRAALKRECARSGVKRIRVHDLRHPYVKSTTKIIFFLPTQVIFLYFQKNDLLQKKDYSPDFSDISRILHALSQELVYE